MTTHSISCGLPFFDPIFLKMPSLPRIRDSISFAFFRSVPRTRNDLEDFQARMDALGSLINERIDKLLPPVKPTPIKGLNSSSFGIDAHSSRTLPLFRYDTGPIEIQLCDDGCGETKFPAKEDLGFFTEKCVISFTKPCPKEEDQLNFSDPTANLGDLRIVVGLECANPKPGIQFHRLKNIEISGCGPTRWTLTAFFKDHKIFERHGVSTATQGESFNLGSFEFSFIA